MCLFSGRKTRPYPGHSKKTTGTFTTAGNVLFHQDNAPAHTAAITQLGIGILGFDKIFHAPYIPDLAPMDVAVFSLITIPKGVKG